MAVVRSKRQSVTQFVLLNVVPLSDYYFVLIGRRQTSLEVHCCLKVHRSHYTLIHGLSASRCSTQERRLCQTHYTSGKHSVYRSSVGLMSNYFLKMDCYRWVNRISSQKLNKNYFKQILILDTEVSTLILFRPQLISISLNNSKQAYLQDGAFDP